jgi:hypothetical protein
MKTQACSLEQVGEKPRRRAARDLNANADRVVVASRIKEVEAERRSAE